MGGTFNPIHLAHLVLAETARDVLALERVYLMPTGSSPHKEERTLLPLEQRMEMIRLAVAGNDSLFLSDFETRFPGKSYTYKTAERLSTAYPGEEFYYLMGGDSLAMFGQWVHPEIISRHFHLAAVVRDGEDTEDLEKLAEEYGERFGARVHIVPCPLLQISSTEIRRRRAEDRSIRYLVPEAVREYILEKGLYDGTLT